jgi:RND family efflux transporter MFP subunit
VGQVRFRFRNWKFWSVCALIGAGLVFGGRYYLGRKLPPAKGQVPDLNEAPEEVGETQSVASASIHVEVIHPLRGKVERRTVQPGTVQSFQSVQLYSAVSGYLQKQTVDIGDQVKRGQLLIKVDVPELEKQVARCASLVDQTRAGVDQMKARVATARAELEAGRAAVVRAEAVARSAAASLRFREQQLQRMKKLFALKSIDERLVDEKSEQRDAALEAERAAQAAILSAKAQVTAMEAKVAQAQADVAEAQAEVRVAEADLERAQVRLKYSTIVAPFDGVITQRSLFVGDFVRAATESGNLLPLLTVQRTDLFRVVVQIPDREVRYTDPGDEAVVEIDALPGEKFPAKISRIADSEDPGTRLMRVELDVPNPKGVIRNGMYGRVTIILEKALNQLSIPSSCLIGRSRDGKASVYVVRDGHAHLVPIEVGMDNGLEVVVLRGLTRKDQVIQQPGNELAEGAPVVAVHVQEQPAGQASQDP